MRSWMLIACYRYLEPTLHFTQFNLSLQVAMRSNKALSTPSRVGSVNWAKSSVYFGATRFRISLEAKMLCASGENLSMSVTCKATGSMASLRHTRVGLCWP